MTKEEFKKRFEKLTDQAARGIITWSEMQDGIYVLTCDYLYSEERD